MIVIGYTYCHDTAGASSSRDCEIGSMSYSLSQGSGMHGVSDLGQQETSEGCLAILLLACLTDL